MCRPHQQFKESATGKQANGMAANPYGTRSSSKVGPLNWVRFFREKAKLVLIWPLAALVASVIGWTVLLLDMGDLKQAYEKDALSDTAALSQSYAESLQRSIELVDQLMLHVRYENEMAQGKLRFEEIARRGLFLSPSVLYITLVDRNGIPQTSTAPIKRIVDFKDDPVFLAQQADTKDALYIGKPVPGVSTGQNVIHLSRRLSDSSGDFAGIVAASVTPDYLAAGYSRAILGKYGFLGLVGSDATVHVTRTGDVSRRGQTLTLPASPGLPALSGSFQLEGNTWFSDKRNRFVGWKALEGYPLIAMIGLDSEEALSSYQANRASTMKSAVWATAALFLFAMLAMGLSFRLAWRKHKLDVSEATYQMAAESGTEGLFIGQPIIGVDNSVVDVLIVDCNQRAAGFLRRRREEVVGKTVLALYEGRNPAKFLGQLRKAVYTGSFEGEFEVSVESPLTLKWIHLKILRSNGDLAITIRDIGPSKAHVAELERQSNEDVLTGLPNRQWFQGYLPRALDHAIAAHTMVALLFLDLDGFKAINDTLGHPAGDELLQNAAQRLKLAVRPHDHVVRLGGDEFVVIVEHVLDTADIENLANRIVQAFQESFRLSQGVASVGTSIGISIFPAHGADPETLIKHADIALYAAKAGGKGSYAFFDEKFSEVLHARTEKEAEFRKALERDEFLVLYQPRVAASDGTLLGMEALMCWTHPVRGQIKPSEFLRLAEETGLIVDFGKLVVEKVCCQLAGWIHGGKEPAPVSINVSHRELINADMVEFLSATLARYQINPGLVQLELKEQTAMGADAAVRQELKTIQQAGIKLLIDNFGTGDLSISKLQKMAFDLLKVHSTMTAKIHTSEEGSAFFAAVIPMAHALGMRVVAEGVETEAQAHALRDLGCDELQGFYVSKPLRPGDITALLQNSNPPSERTPKAT
jgi:diguanylate cyclase (GGDEF)-like protein